MSGSEVELTNPKIGRIGKTKKQFKPSRRVSPPLMCWDIYLANYQKILKRASVRADLQAIRYYAEKFKWNTDLDELLNSNSYQALILTDNTKRILWVNQGFTEMTGYPKIFAINQFPEFLQGKNTSEATKKEISNKLKLMKPFKEVIINYRKDKTMYKCELNIFPLIGQNSFHFLALEREVA